MTIIKPTCHEEGDLEQIIEAFTGRTSKGIRSLNTARLDILLSITGVILAVYMVMHMFLVSSILLGKEVMYTVARFFELGWIFGTHQPVIVSIISFGVLCLFAGHAFLAIRRFPASYRAYRRLREHARMMHHGDTNMWIFQAVSGFIMFFAASVHILMMMTQPENIGPYASADRVWSDNMWMVYLVLLICVEMHAAIGLYRACMKWGILDGDDPETNRAKLKRYKTYSSAFFLTLGSITLATYMYIGYMHEDKAGERYVPSYKMTQVQKG